MRERKEEKIIFGFERLFLKVMQECGFGGGGIARLFLYCTSTRRISQYLLRLFNVKVYHVTIANWTKKFAAYFKLKFDNLLKGINLSDSD